MLLLNILSLQQKSMELVLSATDGVRRSQKYLDTFMGFAESRRNIKFIQPCPLILKRKQSFCFSKI